MIYIYTLKDPITQEIRYVGKTRDLVQRLRQHICTTGKSKSYKKSWIISLKAKELLPIMDVIDVCEDEDQDWVEIYWISQLKSWGFNLTNLTSGGEGIKHYKHTVEAIEKIKQAGMGRKVSQKCIDALVAYNTKERPESHRKKQSNSMMGKSPPNKGVPMSEEQKALLSSIKSGVPLLKKRIPILQFSLKGEYIAEWDSATSASKVLGIQRVNIIACLAGRRKKCGGYVWKYKIEDIVQP